MSQDFDGKVCLITGASRGIGRETAELLAQRGATVVVSSRDGEACTEVAKRIEERGGRAVARGADVTSPDDCFDLVEFVQSRFGRLDGAFNNAGQILGAGPLQEITLQDFEAAMRVNAGGVFNTLRAQLPVMTEAGRGAIVINSALSGVRAAPAIGAYSAAKAAAITLGRVAAKEAGAHGVRVNVIAPGYIGTDAWMSMLGDQVETLSLNVPLARIAKPLEVAETVSWLLSDAAGYVNGAIIPIDGGMSA